MSYVVMLFTMTQNQHATNACMFVSLSLEHVEYRTTQICCYRK